MVDYLDRVCTDCGTEFITSKKSRSTQCNQCIYDRRRARQGRDPLPRCKGSTSAAGVEGAGLLDAPFGKSSIWLRRPLR